MIACADSVQEEMKKTFEEIHPRTKQVPQHTIAVDKATAHLDASRQISVTTYINRLGNVIEKVLSLGRIFDKNAEGCLEQLSLYARKFIILKNVIAVCTDMEAVYSGVHSGLVERIKVNPEYDSRTIHLPDLCHCLESLLNVDNYPTMDWLKETTKSSASISTIFNSRSTIFNRLSEMINFDFSNNQVVNKKNWDVVSS